VTSVLVGYASKHGSTAEIAQVIADKMRESGLDVDCKPLHEVGSLKDYDAVVLGSALYAGHWRGEARRFLHAHAEGLSERPLWIFSSGPVGQSANTLEPASLEPKRVMAEVEKLGARGHVVFGGRLPTQPHGPLEQVLVRHTPKQYRDRRHWAEIREWASQVAETLVASGARSPGSQPDPERSSVEAG
jgi:menaquinone-dependent protoporphyrinogen oxidase